MLVTTAGPAAGQGHVNLFRAEALGLVVHADRIETCGKQFLEPGLDPFDHGPGIGARTHHDDAAHRLTLAVPLRQTTTDLGADRHPRHVPEQYRNSTRARTQDDRLEIRDIADIAQTAHHELAFRELDDATPDIDVGALNGALDLTDGNAVGAQAYRIHFDLVLTHEATHRRHLGNPVDRGQAVAQIPVLNAPQLGQRMLRGVEHVHEGPADAGGVGSELRHDTRWQLP